MFVFSTVNSSLKAKLDEIAKEEVEFHVQYDNWKKQYRDWQHENKGELLSATTRWTRFSCCTSVDWAMECHSVPIFGGVFLLEMYVSHLALHGVCTTWLCCIEHGSPMCVSSVLFIHDHLWSICCCILVYW